MKFLIKVGDTLPILEGLARVFVRRRLFILANVSSFGSVLGVSGLFFGGDFTGAVGGFLDVAPGLFFVVPLLFASAATAVRRLADILIGDGGVFLFRISFETGFETIFGILLSILPSRVPFTYE